MVPGGLPGPGGWSAWSGGDLPDPGGWWSAWSGGVCLVQGGLPGPGGCLPGGGVCPVWGVSAWCGVCLVRGVGGIPACTEADPPVNRMTDRCKNITLATTSLRPVIMV